MIDNNPLFNRLRIEITSFCNISRKHERISDTHERNQISEDNHYAKPLKFHTFFIFRK